MVEVTTSVFLGFLWAWMAKNPACNVGHLGLDPLHALLSYSCTKFGKQKIAMGKKGGKEII